MDKIKVGDIVTLKCDPSIKMVVGSQRTASGACKCFYLSNGEIKDFEIDPKGLVKLSD
jgi:hypothetical protein